MHPATACIRPSAPRRRPSRLLHRLGWALAALAGTSVTALGAVLMLDTAVPAPPERTAQVQSAPVWR